MSEFANYVEYCVEKRPEGSYRTKRILLLVGCILVALAIIPVVTFSELGKLFLTMVPLWMVLVGIFYWFVSRFVNIEYEYKILQGEFQMDIIYGQRQRKQVRAVRIKEMTKIHPYVEAENKDEVFSCVRVDNCAISLAKPTPDIYFFTYKNEAGENCAMLFEATKKTLEIMKFYNRSVLTEKDDLRH